MLKKNLKEDQTTHGGKSVSYPSLSPMWHSSLGVRGPPASLGALPGLVSAERASVSAEFPSPFSRSFCVLVFLLCSVCYTSGCLLCMMFCPLLLFAWYVLGSFLSSALPICLAYLMAVEYPAACHYNRFTA